MFLRDDCVPPVDVRGLLCDAGQMYTPLISDNDNVALDQHVPSPGQTVRRFFLDTHPNLEPNLESLYPQALPHPSSQTHSLVKVTTFEGTPVLALSTCEWLTTLLVT